MPAVGERLTVAELAAAVVAQDEGVRDELKGLVTDVIRHMRYTMRHGEPAQKTALAKTILPQLLTAINKVDQNEGEAEERAAYQRLMEKLTGKTPEHEEPDTTPEAAPDQPPAPTRKKAAKR